MRTIEQERAKYAWECVMEIKNEKDGDLEEKYNSYANSSPVLILTNGLGNVLAFYKSKIKKEDKSAESRAYEFLYKHINGWLAKRGYTNGTDVLEWIIEKATSMQVFYASQEAIMLLTWIKTFAKATLKKEEG